MKYNRFSSWHPRGAWEHDSRNITWEDAIQELSHEELIQVYRNFLEEGANSYISEFRETLPKVVNRRLTERERKKIEVEAALS